MGHNRILRGAGLVYDPPSIIIDLKYGKSNNIIILSFNF